MSLASFFNFTYPEPFTESFGVALRFLIHKSSETKIVLGSVENGRDPFTLIRFHYILFGINLL